MGHFTVETIPAKSLLVARYTKAAVLVLLCLLTMTACIDPNVERKQLLRSDLQQVDNDSTRLSQTVSNRKNTVGYLEQQVLSHRSDLSDYKGRVEAYMMNHKMALTAIAMGIGGGIVAIDPNNEFSSDVKTVAGFTTLLAAGWALNNSDEIAEVADTLNQADSHVKSLERQILELSSQLASESQQLSREEQTLHILQVKREQIREELEALR